ncbi:pyridoxal phosphate-dependent aminotransferase [Dyella sp.]|uniref:pyridoxal phosphate-dependent aminotransferase n=1 Tax=Dyella sp. TaxID=1869338 RepID=UPI002ED37DE7
MAASPTDLGLNTNIMDTWLVENDHKVRINLGESHVTDLDLAQAITPASELATLGDTSLGNNSTWGSQRLREAIASTYPGVDPDQILVTAGVSEAIVALSAAHNRPGANMVIPVPAFHALMDVPKMFGMAVREVPLVPSRDFRLPAAEVIAAIDEDTSFVLLNSPHNPTGMVYRAQDVMAIADTAADVGAVVVVDEHYRYLPGSPTDLWVTSAIGLRPNVVTFGSLGKCFGCTGLRVGWIIAEPELIARYHHFKLLVTHTISPLSDRIATILLEQREHHLSATVAQIHANLGRLEQTQARCPDTLTLYRPDAGSTAFIGLPTVGDTFAFAQRLLDETGVLILPGESFELPGFARMRLGIDSDLFDQACQALEQLLLRHRADHIALRDIHTKESVHAD